jgi:hypothetical protein
VAARRAAELALVRNLQAIMTIEGSPGEESLAGGLGFYNDTGWFFA